LDLRASGIVPGLDMPLSIYHDYWSGEMLPQPGWVIQNCLANAAFYLSGPNTVVRSCVINGLANSKPRWAGLVFRSPVNTDGIVEYCDISNFTDRGIWFFYSADRGVVRYNTVHDIVAGSDNPGTCINMDGFGTPVVDAQVYGNLCHTSPRGIEFENGTRGKAYFNLVRDCTVSGISVINYDAFVTQPSNIEISYNLIRNTNIGINLNYVQTIKFIHNTIAVPTGANSQGFCIQSVDTTVSGITFTNNIIAGAWTNPIRAQTGKNVWAQFDYNDIMPAASSLIYFQFGTGTNWTLAQVQSNLGAMTHGITGDPQFVSGSDFSLQSGSPAKGTGLDLGTTYNQGLLPTTVWPDDIDVGTQAGGAWNMGAYLQPAPVIPPIGPSEGNIAWIQSGGKGELKVADLSKSRITTVTSATLKGTPGQFYGCIIGAMAANGVIEVYDALTVTGTPVLVLTSPATLTQSQGVFALPHPIRMAIGITVRTITAAQDVTMLWN